MDVSDIDPALYTQLLSSGTDISKLQTQLQAQQALSSVIKSTAAPSPGYVRFSTGASYQPTSKLSILDSAIRGGLQGAGVGMQQQTGSAIAGAQGSQNLAVLAALMKMRGNPSAATPSYTNSSGSTTGMVDADPNAGY
jgi:hypothetical protein